jgi:hypothetical protein
MTDWRTATEDDLLALIANGETDSHSLDFKQRDSLIASTDGEKNTRRLDLSKDILSFAHADGGTIIYGMEEAGIPPIATRLRGFKPGELTRESLAQLIQTAPQPAVSGVLINPVLLQSSDLKSDPGTVAYVVVIPQSDTIHQARDGKFHRRDNTTTRAMHRDELLDVLSRAHGARLRLSFALEPAGNNAPLAWARSGPAAGWSGEVTLGVVADNRGKIALYSLYRLFVEPGGERIQVTRYAMFGDDFRAPDPPGAVPQLAPWRRAVRQLLVPHDPPIFPGSRVRIGGVIMRVHRDAPPGPVTSKRIYWQCVAPDMVDAHGGVILQREGDALVLRDIPEGDVEGFFGLSV